MPCRDAAVGTEECQRSAAMGDCLHLIEEEERPAIGAHTIPHAPTEPCRTAYFPYDARKKDPAAPKQQPAAVKRTFWVSSGQFLFLGVLHAKAGVRGPGQSQPLHSDGPGPFCIARISACGHTWWVQQRYESSAIEPMAREVRCWLRGYEGWREMEEIIVVLKFRGRMLPPAEYPLCETLPVLGLQHLQQAMPWKT